MVVAIDFSKTNEKYQLHTYDSTGNNQYLNAIQQVCDIVIDVDSDKKVPVYGFGAKVNKNDQNSSQLFPLNNDVKNPDVDGIEGIKNVYRQALSRIQLGGPTKYVPLLEHMIKICKTKQKNMTSYMILLIFVDGLIDDYEETKAIINMCTKLPLSIVIIGIGIGNYEQNGERKGWEAMREFDN